MRKIIRDDEHRYVTVIDISMPFWSMVFFMIKWAFASIPAGLVLWGIAYAFMALFGML